MKINKLSLLFLFLPTILALFFVYIIPLVQLIGLSFTDASISRTINFVGFTNYQEFFVSAEIWQVLGRTILWTLLGLALKMSLGFGGAILLNANVGNKGFFRSLVLAPWVMPLTISAIVWTWLLNGQFGMINYIFQKIYILTEPFEFLGTRVPALISLIVVDAWAGIPLITIFLIAALESIPVSSLEAAFLEGANPWERFIYVIFPQTLPVALSLATVTAIFTFNSFDVIWVMTQGGPSDGTTTLPILAYRTAIKRFHLGLGAAQSAVMTLAIVMLGIVYIASQKKTQTENPKTKV